MSSARERGGRWLRGELPGLIASGVITEETSRALAAHYPEPAKGSSRSLAFVLLAIIGSALIAGGIILLIAHNWDEFSRPLRSAFAFVPLLAAQALALFVLLRRDGSQAWRESAAIFLVAAIGTAIAVVSQTYQIHGSIAQFILTWLFLGLSIVYVMRTTFGACVYICGATIWLTYKDSYPYERSPLLFWGLLLLVAPYFALLFRRTRTSRETTALATVFAIGCAIGIGYTESFSKANIGVLSYAGLFALVYLCGIEFFATGEGELPPLARLAAIAIGVLTIVLTFHDIWMHSNTPLPTLDLQRAISVAILLFFPLAAVLLAAWTYIHGKIHFSILAVALPIVTGAGWMIAHFCPPEQITWSRSNCDFYAAMLFNVYALALGVELIARGLRADSMTRVNFGLAIIAALAIARFFDSDLSFVVRAIGFIVIGLGFLATNFILFKKRRPA
ncbi:MAG: DUF2157 domain-containing protein [Chthoniobacterales bacterium]